MAPKRLIVLIPLWLLTVLETLTMGLAGAAKFMGDTWPEMFAAWGYPIWFTYVVGVLEIVGALLLLVPRAAVYAAGSLMVIMLGALVTELRQPQVGWLMPVVHLAVLSAIILLRRKTASRKP